MDPTVNISIHAPVFEGMAARHQMPVTEVVDRILRHGIEHEYEVFDWSPSPLFEVEPAPIEAPLPDPPPREIEEGQCARGVHP